MLSINVSDLIYTIINFLVLVFLLNRFLFKPVGDFIDKRNEKIARGFEAEKHANEKLEVTKEAYREKEDELKNEEADLFEGKIRIVNDQNKKMLKAATENANSDKSNFSNSLALKEAEYQAKLDSAFPELTEMLAASLKA